MTTNQMSTQNAEPIVKDVVLNAPASKVWAAITDKNKMKEWYFDIPDFKPEVGCEFNFTAGGPDMLYVHLCKVLEVIPDKKLVHSWRYEGYEGDSIVTWELFEQGNTTRVVLTHTGLETFPDIKAFAKENFIKGWTDIVTKNLPNYISKA
jgi:uncharacterized protein YndB with AHSA1/START domain